MSLGTLPPWLQTPNFVGAGEAGLNAALQMRQQNSQRAEAGDRLQLAYDQLASEERRASMLAQNRQEMARAALELRASQAQALQDYREQNLQHRADALEALTGYRGGLLDQREKNASALADYRDQLTGLKNASLEQTIAHQGAIEDERAKNRELREAVQQQKGTAPIHLAEGGVMVRYNPDTKDVEQIFPKVVPPAPQGPSLWSRFAPSFLGGGAGSNAPLNNAGGQTTPMDENDPLGILPKMQQ